MTEGVTTVGAHQFRNHFGWYMERAIGGEVIQVTRRGKPSVKLVAADAHAAPGGESGIRSSHA